VYRWGESKESKQEDLLKYHDISGRISSSYLKIWCINRYVEDGASETNLLTTVADDRYR